MNALIIIDMQPAYFKSPGLLGRRDALVQNINKLAAEFRSRGDLIVNIRTVHKKNKSTWTLNMLEDNQGFAFDGASETETIGDLSIDGALELTKTRDSAFYGTELLNALRDYAVTGLTLAGVSTHSCIFQTAADAYAHNLPVNVVSSAVDDEDQTLQRQALEYLEQEYRQHIL